MSSSLKTATAHNAPHVGYYKFTANSAAELRALDKLLRRSGAIRIHSTRVQTPPQASLGALEQLFETLGCKLTTIAAVQPQKPGIKIWTAADFKNRKSPRPRRKNRQN